MGSTANPFVLLWLFVDAVVRLAMTVAKRRRNRADEDGGARQPAAFIAHGHQTPATAADGIRKLDRIIAEISTDSGELGYLSVLIQEGTWSDGRSDIGVDLAVVLPGESGWQFTDRADPDPDDALVELETGVLDWYGECLTIIRWVVEEEAQVLRAAHFAD